MKKQKAVGRSKAKDFSLEVEAVQALERDVIAGEAVESQSTEIEQKDAFPPGKEESQSAPQISRNQKYWLSIMLIFADCGVQKSADGVFDVLARNFEHTGALSWWLWKIGHGEMTRFLKGKDIVDAIRKIAYELYRILKSEVGKPVARF
jgi:hypothetical protein